MKKCVVYVHGKGGSIAEAAQYGSLFPGYDVIGFDYQSASPWEAKKEFPAYFEELRSRYDRIILIANSIGACFSMYSLSVRHVDKAFLISPVADMERLILDMLMWTGKTENELKEAGEITTPFGETLSWDYLTYVRENPIEWNVPTDILYGGKDELISLRTISDFAYKTGAGLTVMKDGEHWFHTVEQMDFLCSWIREHSQDLL